MPCEEYPSAYRLTTPKARYQCLDAHVPVWVKQDCAAKSGQQGRLTNEIWNLKQLPR